MNRVGGIVVCGGESRRMGRPKAWLPCGDEFLLQRMVRILGGVVSPVVVVAAQHQELPLLPDSVLVARDERPAAGPLEGIRVGLARLAAKVEAAFVASCDAPGLRADVIDFLIRQLGVAQAAVPCDDKYVHCLQAVYRTELVSHIERLFAEGERRPRVLFDRVATHRVPLESIRGVDPSLESFRNVNTPREYAEMLKRLLEGVSRE